MLFYGKWADAYQWWSVFRLWNGADICQEQVSLWHDDCMNAHPHAELLVVFFQALRTISRSIVGCRLMANRFFFIDSLRFDNSVTFKMLRHHFRMMFRFCAAVLSMVAFASSRKVTSRRQCIPSIHQCPRTARLQRYGYRYIRHRQLQALSSFNPPGSHSQ